MTPKDAFWEHPVRNGAGILLTAMILLATVFVSLNTWGVV